MHERDRVARRHERSDVRRSAGARHSLRPSGRPCQTTGRREDVPSSTELEAKTVQEPALLLFYTCLMNRRELFTATVAAGVAAAVPQALHAANLGSNAPRLPIPKDGTIRVAFMISKNANVIDLAGPWETFQDVRLPNDQFPFEPYTIAETADPVQMTDGLKITPTYTFDTMPQPHIICVGANSNESDAVMHMLRN